MRPTLTQILVGVAVLLAWPLRSTAIDVYGNATPWTNSDTIIWELHQKQNAFVPPSSGPSWQSQLSALESQRQLKARDAARALAEARELKAWAANRVPDKPLTWAQEMERYVMQNGDSAAKEQEQVAFYYANAGDFSHARRHLEMVAFRKGPRAGEAAWLLYEAHSPDGIAPDPKAAAWALAQARAVGFREADWKIASTRFLTDPDGARPQLEVILAGNDYRLAARAGRLLLADAYAKKNDPQAIAVLRRLVAIASRTNEVRDSDYTSLAQLLIRSPGSWKEYHAEIISALRATFGDSSATSQLVLVYLGLDPSAAPFVAISPENADAVIETLARQSPGDATQLALHFLAPGAQQNLPVATRLLSKLADLHPERDVSMERYAELLTGNFGGQPDLPRARHIYEILAARPGASPAMLTVAARLIATDFPGQPADLARAFALFDRAAQAGDVYAQYRYTEALLNGRGTPADPARARDFIESATRSQHPDPAAYPLFALGSQILRESSAGDPQLLRNARYLADITRDFAPSKLQRALATYALAHSADSGSIEDDDRSEAFASAQRAATSGLSEARLLLARFYREGFGVPADLSIAYSIYEDGAKAGDALAMASLASLQLEAGNPYSNPIEGFRWAGESAERKNAEGIFLLGRCFLDGQGTSPDAAKGLALIERAAAAGQPDAFFRAAGLLLEKRSVSPAERARAVGYLSTAATAGNWDAALRLMQTLATDPALTPTRRAQLNALIASANPAPIDDAALIALNDQISAAATQLEQLTLQRNDPALAYETAQWLRGEPSQLAPSTGLKYPWGDLMFRASQGGHPGARYQMAFEEIAKAREFLKKPAEDAANEKEWGVSRSDGHFSTALENLRAAAQSGHAPAVAFLKARGIALSTSLSGDTLDREGIDKIKSGGS